MAPHVAGCFCCKDDLQIEKLTAQRNFRSSEVGRVGDAKHMGILEVVHHCCLDWFPDFKSTRALFWTEKVLYLDLDFGSVV